MSYVEDDYIHPCSPQGRGHRLAPSWLEARRSLPLAILDLLTELLTKPWDFPPQGVSGDDLMDKQGSGGGAGGCLVLSVSSGSCGQDAYDVRDGQTNKWRIVAGSSGVVGATEPGQISRGLADMGGWHHGARPDQ